MAPDSNTRVGGLVERSTSAGIFEFGLIATKPEPNWSPSPILISQASYSAPLWPAASSSSNMTVTFTPFGVRQRIELERVFSHRQRLVMCGPAIGTVDVGEAPARFLVPGPDFGRHVFVVSLMAMLREVVV